QESNLHGSPHQILSLARLPIPPHSRFFGLRNGLAKRCPVWLRIGSLSIIAAKFPNTMTNLFRSRFAPLFGRLHCERFERWITPRWRSLLVPVVLMLFICTGGTENDCRADDEFNTALRKLNSVVTPADQRTVMANQVQTGQRQRLREANVSSSRDWQAVRGLDDWKKLRGPALAALRKSLSLTPWPRDSAAGPVHVETAGQITGEGFVVEKIVFESHPAGWVSANLYRPQTPGNSMPGIVISHAHHTSKEHGELQDMGMTWARAGCLVLIPDHLGHGERRQHPFASAADFEKKYRVGPADYYFRYDAAMQLDLIGESLIGCMVRDLSRGVDVLLAQQGIDPGKIILLGAVAGGGDPAAVAGALDQRFAAVVPFNFGGPQPETKYPLPDNTEASFDYAGSGGWESTRNLRASAAEGFLPWVIVGSIAPRRLVYGHEFRWDQERDPVWKRLQTIYGLFDASSSLAYTHGHGELKGQPPEASHCTHIGKPHRVRIHQAFDKWFGIKVSSETEYSHRIPAEQLRCWTPNLKQKLRPQTLAASVSKIAKEQILKVRNSQENSPPHCRRIGLRMQWQQVLGETLFEQAQVNVVRTQELGSTTVTSVLLTTATRYQIPCLLFVPELIKESQPVVLGICSQGKDRLLVESSDKIAAFLRQGSVVCLCDPRGIGESGFGSDHGRRSDATAIASTELMLGGTLLGSQLGDVRTTLAWLRSRPELKGREFHLWGESFTPPNPATAQFRQPRDNDQALPAPSEPQAALLALLTGLFEQDVVSIEASGGIASWDMLLDGYLVLMAYDAMVPGVLKTGDISDLVLAQRPETKIRLVRSVDGLNRTVSTDKMRELHAERVKMESITFD
ncbi:MAG: hypothetical protein JWM11_1692, partial [Planctomycetaceae bacterium]|nr:hypothetical protein [Planctomycetaceae bacterium]